MQIGSPSLWRDIVRAYVQRFPVRRGKRRVMETAAWLYAGSEEQLCELPGGSKIRVDLHEHVQRWIYFFGAYEEQTVRWFRGALRPGMTVLDVGAHVGQYTLVAASDVGAKGRVHAFEPNPGTFKRLSANIELNGYQHVEAHPVALSDAAGAATLYVPKHDNIGEASLQPCQDGMDQTSVRTTTLDEWVKTADLGSRPRIDLMKIDVQGFEAKVIQGGRETLSRFRPTIVCEFEERWLHASGTSSVDLKRVLFELGYEAKQITASGLAPVRGDEIHSFDNLVLVPKAAASA
jgi:FkbM family methyltransferase